MRINKSGFRLSKNGSILLSIEKEAIKKDTFCGQSIKENGTYYFLDRKQGSTYVYLP